ncbi:hypothetical protein [Collinsella tanakaei]|uniref:hypothetical protein n=1 Tax=Collinsella tanakaei TaxID=626935 RepID=UPI0025A45A8C|nr:hypothetical protein [Collinsella tanakaei]MDM8301669.1 hypothetical protein [Collinsella tanakaei]
MLNSLIRVDLHIHSKASSYKDKGVDLSACDAEHVDVLLDKLVEAENSIDMFSVTDHNRFDAALYEEFYNRIGERGLNIHLLSGVEFDVELQKEKPAAHIITIFNAIDTSDREKIQETIKRDGLVEDESGFYTLDEFESLLRHVGLSAILIVHQHSGFGGNQRKRSAGSASDDAIELYQYGFFDALEYNNRRVQGILRGELADLRLPARMVVGSDCHEWSCYPRHDHSQTMPDAYYAEIRALPTFCGLLMALTSPDTRIGRRDYEWKDGYCPEIELCGRQIPLSPGLNVLIGENGSGKSSLLDLLCDKQGKKAHVKKIGKEYDFCCKQKPMSPVYIQQGQLQESYGKGTMFDASLFEEPNNTSFDSAARAYAGGVKNIIADNISRNDLRKKARSTSILPAHEEETFKFTVTYADDFANEGNPWASRASQLQTINSLLEQETAYSDNYTADEIEKLKKASALIEEVRSSVAMRSGSRIMTNGVKSIILRAFKKYEFDIESRSSDLDRKSAAYRKDKAAFVDTVVDLARAELRESPKLPSSIVPINSGATRNQQNGFSFVRRTAYSDLEDYADDFLQSFNTQYRSIDKLLKIDTREEAARAIPGGKSDTWESDFDGLTKKFIERLCVATNTILDGEDKATGNTLGERALTYYKYLSYGSTGAEVFIADQPEDNISNQRISSDLIEYLADLRRRSQVIIVTHNPLLVVNLDADNVIALRRDKKGSERVVSGCLESEDTGSVLSEVASILDGGKEAIKRRLAAYGSLD